MCPAGHVLMGTLLLAAACGTRVRSLCAPFSYTLDSTYTMDASPAAMSRTLQGSRFESETNAN